MTNTRTITVNSATQQPGCDCNYADDYYGDRVCVPRPQAK